MSGSNQHSSHTWPDECIAADERIRILEASDESGRAVAEFYEEKLRSLEEQLQAALKDSERRTDLLNAAIDRAESAEQLYEDTHTSYTEALGEVAEAWGKYSGLKEQLETAQDALDRIADSKKHDEAHEGYCGWCHLIDIARAANDRYPATSPSYDKHVDQPAADSQTRHNDASSPATKVAPGVGRLVHDEPARGDGTQAGSDVPDPASDPLGYIELDERGNCRHGVHKALGCRFCDPVFSPAMRRERE